MAKTLISSPKTPSLLYVVVEKSLGNEQMESLITSVGLSSVEQDGGGRVLLFFIRGF